MEGRSKNPRKALVLQTLLFFLFLLSHAPETTYSQLLHSELIFFQSSTPSPPSKISKTPNTAHLRRILLGILFGSLTGFVLAIVFLFLIHLIVQHANRPPILKGPVVFSPVISPKTLRLALSGEMQSTQLLGLSPNGRYYRVVLDNEMDFAVKRLLSNCTNASPLQNSKSEWRRVQQQLEMLARVKHRSMMSLRAYVRDHDQFSLVYDYIPGGSLEDLMKRVRSRQISLSWGVRYRIAVGMVEALRYLHFECEPRVLHGNLKPSNVMLDEGLEPRLGDSRLARLLATNCDNPGTSDYVAPECYQSSRWTDKSDIYSYGAILAVLLTGRDPSDPSFARETERGGLAQWLRHLQQAGNAIEALDKDILGKEGEEEEMLMAVRITLVCLSDMPADRPSSDELVNMLTQLHSF